MVGGGSVLGVILATAFTHLLGAAFRKLAHVRWAGYGNWPGLVVCVHTMTFLSQSTPK